MAGVETYRERQESELEAIKSIFNDDVADQRPSEGKWVPLDVKIELTPHRDSRVTQTFCTICLHIICPRNYPKVTPKIQLENAKGLKDDDVAKLSKILEDEAENLKGEVMIFELCTKVQEFLHKHNKPSESDVIRVSESFYDAMLKNRQLQDQRKKDELNEKERILQEQISKRREQMFKENRIRKTTNSESSPRHRHHSSSNSEDSRNFYDVCDEHRGTEIVQISSFSKRIQQGACVGHSQKGCVNYSGIDLSTGALYYITEWTVEYSRLEAKNLLVDDVINAVEEKMSEITKLRHKNLVSYNWVLCTKKKDHLQILTVQEFIQGISLFSISGGLGWSSEGASMVAQSVLDSLIYLHNHGISHGNLSDTTVIMDTTGNIRVTDYSFVPYLQELISGEQPSPDLPALGALIESLIPTPSFEMRDFINHCKSDRTLSGSELLDLPFLHSLISDPIFNACDNSKAITSIPHATDRPQTMIQMSLAPLISSDYSRLHAEFDVINFIGKGAYGDVLKVRNKLDNRQYAIKRIPLYANTKQLYKKMTREVELLSRLNHENVVRYFNSWMEIQTSTNVDEFEEMSDLSASNKPPMVKTKSQNRLPIAANANGDDSSSDDSFSENWNYFNANDSSSDGIEFVGSDGKVAEYNDDDSSSGKGSGGDVIRKNTILYIQMEFCEKSTLRTAIDENLYKDAERVWKLFREIVEGLAHIHQQGMIHRDLKPVNVFLDSKDHVKIGDFGLATTSVLALQHQLIETSKPTNGNYGESHTGQVGTALYVAPELEGNASKSTYNQKVDLYSLGIIFFEMIMPPFPTVMERITTIKDLRSERVEIPLVLLDDQKLKNQVELLKCLLSHSPSKRPTSEELLQSELLPPVKMEAYELQEMIRHVLANSQSRTYKHLIARCLAQESYVTDIYSYHDNMMPISSIFENVKNRIVQVLRKHGAIEINTPLLTPYTKYTADSAVKLMCNSGKVVTLPFDLRELFQRHIVLQGINTLRRYAIGRIYREKRHHNFHPKQSFECVFDIVTPNRGNFLVDAEVIVVANEIVSQFDIVKLKNIVFRVNHTSLLRAIFLSFNVPKDKYKTLLHYINDYLEGRMSKLLVKEALKSVFPVKDQMLDILLMTDLTIESINSSHLRSLLKGKGEASALAKGAIRELELIVNHCKNFGVTTPIQLCIGMSSGYDCMRPGSVIWQMAAQLKQRHFTLLASGGRFDNALEDYARQSQYQSVSREMYTAGFSLAIDKLVVLVGQQSESLIHRVVVDVVVYVVGNRPPLKEITKILKSLWTNGIQCSFIEVPTMIDDEDGLARDLGANHILVLGEDGYSRLKSWNNDRYSERNVTMNEIVEYLKKNLNADLATISESFQNISLTRNNSINAVSNSKNYEAPVVGLPNIDINFVMMERLTTNKRKRFENQIEQKLGNVLEKFNKKETFAIFAIELDMKQVKLMISYIDPNPKDQRTNNLESLLARFPKQKQKYVQEVFDEVTDKLAEKKNTSIVCLFSVLDSYYRIIL